MIYRASFLIGTLLAAACGPSSAEEEQKPAAQPATGKIIVALTRSKAGEGSTGLTPYNGQLTLYYVDHAAQRCKSLTIGEAVLGFFQKGTFDGGAGRLFVVELPAGKYTFDSYRVTQGSGKAQ